MNFFSILGGAIFLLICIASIFCCGYLLALLRKNDVDINIRITTKKLKGGKDARLG